jgi:DNA-binding XRE family transcriptional regulator
MENDLEEKLSRWLENEFHVETESVSSKEKFLQSLRKPHNTRKRVLIWSQQDSLAPEVTRPSSKKTSGKSYLIPDVFPDSHPGSRLCGLRGKLGITQAEMAKRLGIAQHHISEMENRKRQISVDMAKRIGSEFGVSYKIFL